MKLKLKATFEMDSPEAIVRRFNERFEAIAYQMEADAVRMCPVDEGRLRTSIELIKVDDGHFILKDGVYYGVLVEKGTSPHIIRVKEKKVLSNVHGSVKSRQKTGGPAIFGKVVRHPGTTASPFFRPALDRARERVRRILIF